MSTSHTIRDFVQGKAELTINASESPAKTRYSPVRANSTQSVKTSSSTSSIAQPTTSAASVQQPVAPAPIPAQVQVNEFTPTPVPADPEYFDVPYKHRAEKEKTPPPEPPVDYEGSVKENAAPAPKQSTPSTSTAVQKTNSNVAPRPLGGRRDGNRQTITKKTRTFMIDGVQVTSTTVHILGVKDDKVQR